MGKKELEKVLSVEQRKICADEIIGFFHKERDEVIGVVAAGETLDAMLAIITPHIEANMAHAVKKLLHERLDDIDIELDMLISEKYGK